jgi:hypothetical protein
MIKNWFISFCLLLYLGVNGLVFSHFHKEQSFKCDASTKHEQHYHAKEIESCIVCTHHFTLTFTSLFQQDFFEIVSHTNELIFGYQFDFTFFNKSTLFLRGPPSAIII